MNIDDFDYDLPAERIASEPTAERRDARLLCLDRRRGTLVDRRFPDLVALLDPGDLLVINDSRVIPARLYARKETGGRVEILVERVLDERRFLAQLGSSKPIKSGIELTTEGGRTLWVTAAREGFWQLETRNDGDVPALLETEGHMPLPPYIERPDRALDRERYQTVFADRPGAVAAPTAGLHFDRKLLAELSERGIDLARVTLHVGAATFQPVRVTRVAEHRMHAERVTVTGEVCRAVAAARDAGRRVVAVGTTVVRALESAAANGELAPFDDETRLYITPGYRFRVVDALVTNFHQPRSTLLVLVSAFAGRERILAAYRHALDRGYRFLSYGDAMFISGAAPP